MSGMALSAFIYAMPSKTAAMADVDAGDSAPLPVDVFEIADAGIYHAPSAMPTTWQTTGDFCGADLSSNDGKYDYELLNGAFNYNVSYYGNKCLLQSTDNTNDIIGLNVDYEDVEANITLMIGQSSDFEIAAVGLRASKNNDSSTMNFCKGYEQYLCVPYIKKNNDDDAEDLIKLKMQQCAIDGTTGFVDEFAQTDRTTYDFNRWYTVSFSAIGNTLKCSLIDDTGVPVLSITTTDDDYFSVIDTGGDVTFGAYGQHFYFGDVSVEEKE
jgi:hypothetical protein